MLDQNMFGTIFLKPFPKTRFGVVGSNASNPQKRLAGVEGLEPPTLGFGDRRQSQFSATFRKKTVKFAHDRSRLWATFPKFFLAGVKPKSPQPLKDDAPPPPVDEGVCPDCKGTGKIKRTSPYIGDTQTSIASLFRKCPTCNGSGRVSNG